MGKVFESYDAVRGARADEMCRALIRVPYMTIPLAAKLLGIDRKDVPGILNHTASRWRMVPYDPKKHRSTRYPDETHNRLERFIGLSETARMEWAEREGVSTNKYVEPGDVGKQFKLMRVLIAMRRAGMLYEQWDFRKSQHGDNVHAVLIAPGDYRIGLFLLPHHHEDNRLDSSIRGSFKKIAENSELGKIVLLAKNSLYERALKGALSYQMRESHIYILPLDSVLTNPRAYLWAVYDDESAAAQMMRKQVKFQEVWKSGGGKSAITGNIAGVGRRTVDVYTNGHVGRLKSWVGVEGGRTANGRIYVRDPIVHRVVAKIIQERNSIVLKDEVLTWPFGETQWTETRSSEEVTKARQKYQEQIEEKREELKEKRERKRKAAQETPTIAADIEQTKTVLESRVPAEPEETFVEDWIAEMGNPDEWNEDPAGGYSATGLSDDEYLDEDEITETAAPVTPDELRKLHRAVNRESIVRMMHEFGMLDGGWDIGVREGAGYEAYAWITPKGKAPIELVILPSVDTADLTSTFRAAIQKVAGDERTTKMIVLVEATLYKQAFRIALYDMSPKTPMSKRIYLLPTESVLANPRLYFEAVSEGERVNPKEFETQLSIAKFHKVNSGDPFPLLAQFRKLGRNSYRYLDVYTNGDVDRIKNWFRNRPWISRKMIDPKRDVTMRALVFMRDPIMRKALLELLPPKNDCVIADILPWSETSEGPFAGR